MEMSSADWKRCSLGDALTLQRGFDLPHRLRRPGDVPVVSSSGISGFHDRAQVSAPGVVTGRYGTIGDVYYLTEDFWPLNTTLFVSDFKNNDQLYIAYLLQTVDFSTHSGKSGVPGVNRNDIHKLSVLIPCPSEQHAVAEALWDVDGSLGALESLIAKKRAIKQAASHQLLTGKIRLPGFSKEWGTKWLRELGQFLKGNGVKGEDAQSGPLACVRYGEIYTTHHNCVRTFHSWISSEVAALATRLDCGDLLFAGSGETKEEIGKCVAFVMETEAYAGGDIVILRPRNIDSLFLGYALNMPEVARQKASLGQGDAVVHISASALGQISLSIPALEEQSAIASVLSDMDAEIAALEARRDKTRAIKRGMMQQLLTGRIRLVEPRVPA